MINDIEYLSNIYRYAVCPPPLMEGYYNNTLHERFWVNSKFDSKIRKKLLQIANEFYKSLELDAPIEDIQLTGSLANYNYTNYSDLDVHIIVDFNKINDDVGLVKKALDGMRFIWNIRHDIVIRGCDVEVYLQDINEQHTASGLYSLLKGEWVKEPSYNPPDIDEHDVELKYEAFCVEIDRLEKELSSEDLSEDDLKILSARANKIKQKIQLGRKECLQRENEFCVENLVFKKLRDSGMIEKLINLGVEAYDRRYSEDELSSL